MLKHFTLESILLHFLSLLRMQESTDGPQEMPAYAGMTLVLWVACITAGTTPGMGELAMAWSWNQSGGTASRRESPCDVLRPVILHVNIKVQHYCLEYWIDEGWCVGRLKEVPGVFSQGEFLQELEENIWDAYHLMIEDEWKRWLSLRCTHSMQIEKCEVNVGEVKRNPPFRGSRMIQKEGMMGHILAGIHKKG